MKKQYNSRAGNALDENALNTQAEGFEFDETDIIYRTLGGGYYGGGSSNAINNQGLAAGETSFSEYPDYYFINIACDSFWVPMIGCGGLSAGIFCA